MKKLPEKARFICARQTDSSKFGLSSGENESPCVLDSDAAASADFLSPSGTVSKRKSSADLSMLRNESAQDGDTLIAVVGPTASGKSDVAMKIALALNGEIVSCDSQDVYRRLDIGTAKPTASDRTLVPHHLIDVCEPVGQMSAGEYVRLADRAIADIRSRERRVVIAGGTGLWLRALIFGMAEIPESRPEVRAVIEEDLRRFGAEALYQKLLKIDPAAAEKIDRNNGVRLVRALEIFQLTGRPPSAIWAEHAFKKPRYAARVFALNPPRDALYERIARRTEAMFSGGLLDEVRCLESDGLADSPALRNAIGYPQALAVIRREMSLESAVAETTKFSRRYAKRQWTWFRAEKSVEWLHETEPEAAAAEILSRLSEQSVPKKNIISTTSFE